MQFAREHAVARRFTVTVRTVPRISARSGMTLQASPAWACVTDCGSSAVCVWRLAQAEPKPHPE